MTVIITLNTLFTNFTETLKSFIKKALDSKRVEMTDFYKLLDRFINTHKAITKETKDRKGKILSYVESLYNNYFDAYKKNYDNKDLTDEEKRKYDYKQFEIIANRDQGPKSTEKEETKTKNLMKCKNHYGLK